MRGRGPPANARIQRITGAHRKRSLRRATDYTFHEGLRDFDEYIGTVDTLGSRFHDHGTAPAALMPAPHAAEIVKQTQKRTPAATGPFHGGQPPTPD